MSDDNFLAALLAVVAQTASDVSHSAIAVSPSRVLLHDSRAAATTLEMEAIAGNYGEVLASHCIPHRLHDRPLVGVLIRTDGDAGAVASKLRADYITATGDGTDAEPF